MIPFRRILFPVDYSGPCLAAVPYVKAMVERFDAELTLLHAFGVPPLDPMSVGYGEGVVFEIPSIPETEKHQAGRLGEYAGAHFPRTKVHAAVKYADPASAIEAEVRHGGIDLVMMPTHGDGAFRRLLLGSVTTKVLHDASCAVWTGTHAVLSTGKPALPLQSIVCALDLVGESSAVLCGAAVLAKTYGASLHIAHSVENPPAAYEIDYGPFRKELIEAAESVLRKIRSEAQVDATITVDSGSAADLIHQCVAAYHAGLVVTGRGHSQGGLSRVWSVLYAIVRESPCPVLSL